MNKIPTIEEMTLLWDVCSEFIEQYHIHCVETIWQTDRVYGAAPELVHSVCDIVGYVELEEDN